MVHKGRPALFCFMELLLQRFQFSETETIGKLFVSGKFECWTLEDASRPGRPKVPGRTAIPAGRYRVVITWSNRFRQRMPLLLNVPGFAGIRIHSGNTSEDTSGCILVGKERGLEYLDGSREAYQQLFKKLDEADNREFNFITIEERRDLQYEYEDGI